MDDAILHALRRDPSPAFTARLRSRLEEPGTVRPHHRHRIRVFAAPALALAAVALLFTVPAVRASAQSFLALFRVVNFVPVTVDQARLDALEGQLDLKTLIGQQVQVIQEPGPATPVLSLDAAASLAGYALQLPRWLPKDTRIIEMAVIGDGVARITGDTRRLNDMLDAVGITDLRAPDGLDGQVATIRVPRGVMIRYEHGPRRTRFYQAPAPNVTVPDGVDLRALGEIGLRLLGVSADEARRFASAIDWTSTLIVPISPKVQSVRHVTINGHSGLAMDYVEGSPTQMVIWSTGERVFGLVSMTGLSDVLEMANSVR